MVEDRLQPDAFENQTEEVERIANTAEVHKDAWAQTLSDMEALAEQREADGWDVVTIAAGDAGPETAEQGVTETHGIAYVIPGNRAEELLEAFEAGQFPVYDVYRQVVDGRLFVVTELLDPDSQTAIFVAGNFWRHQAGALVREAREEETMYTHLQKLDRTHLASFEHEGIEKFFPDPDGVVEDWKAMGGSI